MYSSLGRTVRSVFIPNGVLLAGIVGLLHARVLNVPSTQVGEFFCYCALAAGFLAALRFNSVRAFFTTLLIAFAALAPSALSGSVVLSLTAILLPLDLIAFSLPEDHGFSVADIGVGAAFLFLQFVAIALFSRPELAEISKKFDHVFIHASWAQQGIPQLGLFGFALAALVFLIRFALLRNPIEMGSFWLTCAALLGCIAGVTPLRSFYLATALALLVIAYVENSYRLAFQDELTQLPSRRAFNEAVRKLREQYAVAMVDVDFFKKFNDDYGHDTGDQVLRMVAAKIGRVGGNGKAFRFGGEEFCILFAGCSAEQARGLVEEVRQNVADNTFVVRSPDRELRSSTQRGAPAAPRGLKNVAVTVSIGVAESSGGHSHVEEIICAADEALYAAKRNGRNRVETGKASGKVIVGKF